MKLQVIFFIFILGNDLDGNTVTFLHEPSNPRLSNNVAAKHYTHDNTHVGDLSGSIQEHSFNYALKSNSEYSAHNRVDTIDRKSSETQVISGKINL